MCNTDQFFGTAGNNKSAANERYLWVQPVLHNCVNTGTGIMCTEAGSSALVEQSENYTSCAAWTSSSDSNGSAVQYNPGTGWTLQPPQPCSSSYHVACCAP
jgi:hypothetical protein